MFKQYDTGVGDDFLPVLHSAVEIPTPPPNARPRESVEVRVMMVFEQGDYERNDYARKRAGSKL